MIIARLFAGSSNFVLKTVGLFYVQDMTSMQGLGLDDEVDGGLRTSD